MSKKRKTKFTRIAVAGLTASDGRTIEPQWLRDIAETYDPNLYTARVNVEHFRNASATGPFPCLGDVFAVKVQEDEIQIAGKTEKRLALYAQIDGNEVLQGYIAADQKKFTSIEVEPNFSGSGKAYLMGLAATDSPASLGTEALKFSARNDDDYAKIRKAELDARKKHDTCLFSAAFETRIELEDAGAGDRDDESLIDRIVAKFTAVVKPEPKPEPKPDQQAADPAAGTLAAFTTLAQDIGKAVKDQLAESDRANATRFAKLESELAGLRGDVEQTPERNYTQRPTHSGGDGYDQTDC